METIAGLGKEQRDQQVYYPQGPSKFLEGLEEDLEGSYFKT